MTTKEYNECVELYADRLYRFVTKQLRHEAEAEDMVQTAFEILWRNRFSVELNKARAYLFSVVHHRIMDFVRKKHRLLFTENLPDVHSDTVCHTTPDLKEVLDRALEQLSEVQRAVVLLRDYEGYSYQEIATLTALSESQVKVYIFRARQKLQQILVHADRVI